MRVTPIMLTNKDDWTVVNRRETSSTPKSKNCREEKKEYNFFTLPEDKHLHAVKRGGSSINHPHKRSGGRPERSRYRAQERK